jgi:surfactin synthase thioesterase subunit
MALNKELISLNSVANPKWVIVCLHWVGGAPSAFRPLAKALAVHSITVFGLAFPGRAFTSSKVNPEREVADTVEYVVQVLQTSSAWNPHHLPAILFGHSYGGIVAYEAIKLLDNIFSKLVVSSVPSPTALSRKNADMAAEESTHFSLSDAALVNYIKSIGGLREGVDETFLVCALPTIRQDYHAFETYQSTEPPSSLAIPIYVAYGSEDPIASPEECAGWTSCSACAVVLLPIAYPGHFYLLQPAGQQALVTLLLNITMKTGGEDYRQVVRTSSA